MIAFLRRLLIDKHSYEGPARVEVFGRESHVGWVRSTDERIDMLTVKGEALTLDARARFRLTPITWQELCDETTQVQAGHERLWKMMRDGHVRVEEQRDALASRVADLRKALACVRDGLDTRSAADICNDALAADERAMEEDQCPF